MIIINTLIIMDAIDILPREIWFHILDYIDDNKTYNRLPFVCQLFNQYYINSNKIHIKLIKNNIYVFKNIVENLSYTDNYWYKDHPSTIGVIYLYIHTNYDDYQMNINIYEENTEINRWYSIVICDIDDYYISVDTNNIDIFKCNFKSINEVFDFLKHSNDEHFNKLIIRYHNDIFNIFRKRIMQYIDLFFIHDDYIYKK